MKTLRPLALALALAAAAFAAPAAEAAAQQDPAASTQPQGQQESRRRDRTRLTAEEIQAAPQNSMYDVIQMLRPRWIRERGAQSLSQNTNVRVYLDGMEVGDHNYLRDLDPRRVTGAQFLSPQDATTQFGTDHSRGAILLSTRTQTS